MHKIAAPITAADRREQQSEQEHHGSKPEAALRVAQRRQHIAADIDEILNARGLQRGFELARTARQIDVRRACRRSAFAASTASAS